MPAGGRTTYDVSVIFAIGDVHGCAVELRMLINRLPITEDTTVVFVGDYVDRGPDSKGVVDTILELADHCNVVTLMGNHEQMLLGYLEDPFSHVAGMFIYNGGSATLESYSDGHGDWHIPESHIEFFNNLRLSYETEHDFFVHAGVPDVPLEELDRREHWERMLWTRKPFLNSEYRWSKMIVHGHSRVNEVEVHENRINIDTGCVYRNQLSAIALPGHRVFSVPRQKTEPKQVVLRDQSSTRGAVRFSGRVSVLVHANGQSRAFETVDYSELGMYMREVDGFEGEPARFVVGQPVFGVIGPGDPGQVSFSGTIVRVKDEDRGLHYAVQIDNVVASSPV